MALITCPNCGKRISDKAERCIHCGCDLNPDENISFSAREAYDHACEKYEEAKDLIKELSVWTRTVKKDFSVDKALILYDLLLQCILLRTALKDGYFLENEKVFIEDITDNGDLLQLLNSVMRDKVLSWTELDWDDFMSLNHDARKKLSDGITVRLDEVAKEFVIPFAIIDAATPRNYLDDLMKITGAIIVDLAFVDGDSSRSADFKKEADEGMNAFYALIYSKWIEIKNKYKK